MKIGPDDQMDEALSALFDGELEADSDRALKQQLVDKICADPKLKQRWTDYHLISDSLSNNLPVEICCDLSHRIQQLLENEPCYSINKDDNLVAQDQNPKVIDASSRFSRQASNSVAVSLTRRQLMMKRAAGFAIAASVATVALVSYQIGLQQHADENVLAQASVNGDQQANPSELVAMNPTQMATVKGVTVLASPVNNPQFQIRPSNTAPGVYSPPGGLNSDNNSRYTIGYNVFNAPASENLPRQNLNREFNAGVPSNSVDSSLLSQYLMDHNQRYSNSRVQGILPYARIMSVPTQVNPQ